jgi:hypothetical protein
MPPVLGWAAVSGQHCREQGEEGTAQANEQIGADAEASGVPLALEANEATEEASEQQTAYSTVDDH